MFEAISLPRNMFVGNPHLWTRLTQELQDTLEFDRSWTWAGFGSNKTSEGIFVLFQRLLLNISAVLLHEFPYILGSFEHELLSFLASKHGQTYPDCQHRNQPPMIFYQSISFCVDSCNRMNMDSQFVSYWTVRWLDCILGPWRHSQVWVFLSFLVFRFVVFNNSNLNSSTSVSRTTFRSILVQHSFTETLQPFTCPLYIVFSPETYDIIWIRIYDIEKEHNESITVWTS